MAPSARQDGPMHVDRRTPALLLAVLYVVCGVLCMASAIWPMHRDTPMGFLWFLAALGIGGGTAIWSLDQRLRGRVVHAAVAGAPVVDAALPRPGPPPPGGFATGPPPFAGGAFPPPFF